MEITESTKDGRSRDMGPAILARRMKKWRRWAQEMREHGWAVQEPAE